MDQLEFSIAIHLVRKKLQGATLPKVLPASLKVNPERTASVSPAQQKPQQQQQQQATAGHPAKASSIPPTQSAEKSTPPVAAPPLSKNSRP